MPFEIASLNSSDTTLKVLRGKPFSISLSSFLSTFADETGSSIDFSSSSTNFGSASYNATNDGAFFSTSVANPAVPTSSSVSSTHGTWTIAPTRFAAITCGELPLGVSFFKETIGMVRYCDPLDLLINAYPSNSRLHGSIDTAGTYEFYLIADIVSVPINTYVIATTQSPFNALPHLNQSSYSNVTSSSWTGPYPNIPIQVGYDITKNLVRLSSDTIKVTLIVEEVPTSVVSTTTPSTSTPETGDSGYTFLSPEFYGTASTGSSTSSVDLHTDPVTTSLLTSTSKSVNIQYSTTRTATDTAQAQTYNVVFGGASVLNSPFSFSSASATTASISVQIKRTSSSHYKVDSVINYSSGGGTPLTKTFSKNISLSSLSGNDLIFQVTNNVGGSSPVISTRSAIALVG